MNKISICPFVGLKVSSVRYDYAGFGSYTEYSGKTHGYTEKIISGEIGNAEEACGFGEISRYCADVISGVLLCEKDFDVSVGKLVLAGKYCERVLPVVSEFVNTWICGLYLALGKQELLTELFEKGITRFPFSKDIAAADFIVSFLNDGKITDEKLFRAAEYILPYQYKGSVSFTKDSAAYLRAMTAALDTVMKTTLSEKGRHFFIPQERTVKTRAFPMLLCDSSCEREFEVTYIPYSENEQLLELMCAAVKYTDNLLRNAMGVGSKLAGFTLSSDYRKLISEAIRQALPGFLPIPAKVGRKPKKQTVTAKKEEPAVACEPIDLNIDFTKAKRLEAESWKITELLGSDYGTEVISFNPEEKNSGAKSEDVAHSDISESEDLREIPLEWQEFYVSLSQDEKKILCLVSNGISASAFATKRGGMLMGYADSVNEKASDTYGDIILACDGINVDFIEEYKDELTEIFRRLYNTEVL